MFHDFNSIMVRLKAPNIWECIQRQRYFNSIMVRLKGYSEGIPVGEHNNFNSIMVRLKGRVAKVEVFRCGRISIP